MPGTSRWAWKTAFCDL